MKFYVISNKYKDPDKEHANSIKRILEELGAECSCQDYMEDISDMYRYTDPMLIPKETDCVIVLGGDGTLLQAALDLNSLNIPLFGINIGTLGFLTDTDMESAREALTNIIRGDYETDCRMMIDGRVFRNGELIYASTALNDIVINRSGRLRVIDFDVYVNDEYLNSYSADGVIVSTPTGSTAYSLSAGGPILQPNAKLIMVTPVCPHSLNKRSIILGADDCITIRMGEDKRGCEERVASFDGEDYFDVITGDEIVIGCSQRSARFIKTNKTSFLQRVRQKMM